jgi:Raf kinase inhibitor-like YbhB/YbcL family protein
MRNTYTLLGFSLLLIIGIAIYAFNWGFTNTEDTETIVPQSMASTLTLRSSAFEQGGTIPSKFTCDGEEVNPTLSISGVPEGTKSLALIMDDPDIPKVFKEQRGIDSFDHWTLFNISPETKEIAEGSTVGVVGKNGAGESAYIGPCPPLLLPSLCARHGAFALGERHES